MNLTTSDTVKNTAKAFKSLSLNIVTAMVMAGTAIAPIAMPSAHAVGVPVIDATAITQAISQVNNQIKQIENMRGQLQAMTDNGNFGALLNDPTIRAQLNKYLPKQYSDIFQAAQQGDLGALKQVVAQAQAQEKAAQTAQTGKDRLAASQIYTQAQMIGMVNTMNTRSSQIDSLVNQLNSTQNVAQKQDLMNAIQAQSAMINLDLSRMQVMMKMAEKQEQAAERQANAEAYQKIHTAQTNYNRAKYADSLVPVN